MIEDEVLKLRFKYGSRDALSRIYEKYQDYLLTLAMALSNDVNAAEDILHDVFVSFAKSSDKFRLRGSLKSYLATCVANRIRDRIRKNKRQANFLESAPLPQLQTNGPEEVVIADEDSQLLARALTKLPYEQREVVSLRTKGDMKFSEIARLQNTSINTVQGRYRYGLDKLRSILNGEVRK
jgi:RNA polymerase sigma-70 factor (ECF subfamily)